MRLAAGRDLSPTANTEAGDSAATNAEAGPLGRSAAAGIAWSMAQKWVVRISGLATIAVLTRTVAPEDFGVVAAATAVTPFVLILADLGFTTYVVQSARLTQVLLTTGFWFSVFAGLVLSGGLVLGAPLIAAAFRIPEARPILQVMSISILLVVLSSVPIALLRRRLDFRRLAVQATLATVVSQVVAVALAIRGAGAWALVAQIIVAQAIGTALAWRASGWRPGLRCSWSQFCSMAHFGSKVVSVELASSLRAAGEAAIISIVLGPALLGYFSIGQRLIQITQDLGAAAFAPVSTVVFAKVRESADRLRAAYLTASRSGYALVSPLLTFVAVSGPVLLPLVFGQEWGPSVPVAQALAVAAVFTLGGVLDHSLHYGTGRPGRWLAYAVAVEALTLAATAVLAPRGLAVVALGTVGVAIAATVARWFLVGRAVGIRTDQLAGTFVASMIPIVVSGASGAGMMMLTRELPALPALGIVGTVLTVVHVVVVRTVSPEVLRKVLVLIPLPARFRNVSRWLGWGLLHG